MDIKKMKQEMEEELVSNILPFWINRMTDEVNGGFYGRITGREEVNYPLLSIKSVVHDQSGEHCYLGRQLCIADKFKLMV